MTEQFSGDDDTERTVEFCFALKVSSVWLC